MKEMSKLELPPKNTSKKKYTPSLQQKNKMPM